MERFQRFFSMRPVVLAPMAGVSDPAFRTLCLEEGADLTFTEMVSAKGLYYGSERTKRYLVTADGEHAITVQLFGNDPDVLAREAAHVEELLGPALFSLNINMGCPARKIAGKGDGSALMKDPALAASIVRAVAAAVSVPVTAKFRRGFEMGDETAPDFARRLEDAGAAALTVHGRYAMQFYRGVSDAGCIARVKKAVSIPVLANGDVFSAADALRLLHITKCDGVMVARGAVGNPWIFRHIKAALAAERDAALLVSRAGGLAAREGLADDEPENAARFGAQFDMPTSVEERLDTALRHAQLLEQDPQGTGELLKMRRHAMAYVAGLPGASRAREALCHCCTVEEFAEVFEEVRRHATRSL